eukprot:3332356-Rhodomonas_salina.1
MQLSCLARAAVGVVAERAARERASDTRTQDNTASERERACMSATLAERTRALGCWTSNVTKTRPIYEAATQNVPDSRVKDVCVRYAQLEQSLGEIDRARSIYNYGSQHCDPSKNEDLWEAWNSFEVRGCERTEGEGQTQTQTQPQTQTQTHTQTEQPVCLRAAE